MSHYYLYRSHGMSECVRSTEDAQLAIVAELHEGLGVALQRRDMSLVREILGALEYFSTHYLGVYEDDCSYSLKNKTWTVQECNDYSCFVGDTSW